METKNIIMMVISLAIGVVLIAGVVVPVLSSTIGGSSNSVTFTNEGGRIDDISEITDRYDIHSELETVDEDTDNPYVTVSTGTTRVQFVYENEELVWQFVEFTGPWVEQYPEYRVIQSETITESCVLAITQNTMIAYDHDKKEFQFAYESGSSPTYSISSIVDDHMDVYLMYDLLWDDEEEKEDLGLVFSFDSINGGYFEEYPTGRMYDPNGADTSIYGDTGEIYYDEGNLTFGCLSADGSTASYLISYINDNGEISQISYSGDTVTVGDTIHEEIMGCGYMDLSKGQGVELVITSSNEPYPAISNIYIVPHTVKGTPEEIRNEGIQMSNIKDLVSQGYSYKIQSLSEGSTDYGWYIYDSEDNLIRSAPLEEDKITMSIVSDKIALMYAERETTPDYLDIYMLMGTGELLHIENPTDFILTISKDGNTVKLTATATGLSETVEVANPVGFVIDSEGDWTNIETGLETSDVKTVAYKDINDVYFLSVRAAVYGYQGGTSSALAKLGWDGYGIDPDSTASFNSLVGVTDYVKYKQFNCVDYASYDDQSASPSGILLNITENGEEGVVSANSYIVPTVAYQPNDSGGISPALIAVLSLIPIVMIAGLIVAAIKMWKMQ